jgi:hypothetical protein
MLKTQKVTFCNEITDNRNNRRQPRRWWWEGGNLNFFFFDMAAMLNLLLQVRSLLNIMPHLRCLRVLYFALLFVSVHQSPYGFSNSTVSSALLDINMHHFIMKSHNRKKIQKKKVYYWKKKVDYWKKKVHFWKGSVFNSTRVSRGAYD